MKAAVPPAARADTREQIQVVAMELFSDQGYEATSMREIAERLNITKAALYYHFDSKEGIVRALVDSMVGQVGDLVRWAKAQPVTDELRREVLTRWADIMATHGLRMFRFATANEKVMHDLHPGKSGLRTQMAELYAILTPAGASIEDQLKVRLSLMAVSMGVVTDLDATEAQVLAAGRQLSLDLLPGG